MGPLDENGPPHGEWRIELCDGAIPSTPERNLNREAPQCKAPVPLAKTPGYEMDLML